MSIDLSPGVTVRVDAPSLPIVRADPPSSTVVVVPIAGPRGPQGPSGSAADVGQVKLTATAAATLAGHRAVTQRSDGLLIYADNTTISHLHAPLWVTSGAVSSGAQGEVIVYGTLDEPSWSWTPGAPIYLSASGVLTQTAPSPPDLFLAQLGVATGPTTIFVDRQPSILLI